MSWVVRALVGGASFQGCVPERLSLHPLLSAQWGGGTCVRSRLAYVDIVCGQSTVAEGTACTRGILKISFAADVSGSRSTAAVCAGSCMSLGAATPLPEQSALLS